MFAVWRVMRVVAISGYGAEVKFDYPIGGVVA